MAHYVQRQFMVQLQPENEDHVLEVEGPPRNGLNVGIASFNYGDDYSWEGDVKDGKANGFGTKMFLSGILKGIVSHGEFKDGEEWGNCVGTLFDGNTIATI